MSITPGDRIGPYEVVGLLGAGRMGEVYRAHDHRLRRDVALKVVSPRVAPDAQRRARLTREAHLLATLNHPNIASLYGLEEAGGIQALVLELVEGETLADRLAGRPGGLRLPDALAVAQQVAAALDAAHERGIVHRDLKPANIALRPDGTVKLLDFGLATVLDRSASGGLATATVTLGEPAGAILGTPAYMSPEQARGLPVDRRTDIWAFGCVLYEMLAGRRAFEGDRASDVVAQILEREPELDALPPATPAAVRRMVRRCLVKDPGQRLRDIGDARLELADAAAPRAGDPAPLHYGRRTAIAVAASGVVGAAAAWLGMRPAPEPPALRTSFLDSSRVFPGHLGRSVAISPNGQRWVYSTRLGLVLRSRDRLEERLLPGVSGFAPFFSPDGDWIGFTDGTTLKRVSIASGATQVLAHVGPAATGSWRGADIAFADMHGVFLMRAEPGAQPRLIADVAEGEQAVYPQLLPGGLILFGVIAGRTNTPGFVRRPGSHVEVLNLRTTERRTLLHGTARAQCLPTGHVVYAVDGTLHADVFDGDRLAVRNDPAGIDDTRSVVDFSVSDEGTLVAISRSGGDSVLVWVDREEGREEILDAEPKPYAYPRLSPDGTRVALDVAGPSRNIWILDLRRGGTLRNFTNDVAGSALPAWSPDGEWLVFSSDKFGVANMVRQRSDGAGTPERLLESDRLQHASGFAPDGRLLFAPDVEGHGRDIHALSMDTHEVTPVLYGPHNYANAVVSPDGHWLAFDSDRSGRFEVWVAPYPDAYARNHIEVSAGSGGRQPFWSHEGRELFYRNLSGDMMAVPVTFTPTFDAGRPATLFENDSYAGAGDHLSGRAYDVAGDGRFLMIKETASYELIVEVGWVDEVRRLRPR
jgi:eukaryotic-like serine/threonine-protein kinase